MTQPRTPNRPLVAESLPPIANVYVQVGIGALVVGLGTWFRERGGECRVGGVHAAGAPSMECSWRAGSVVETTAAASWARLVVDGARRPGACLVFLTGSNVAGA